MREDARGGAQQAHVGNAAPASTLFGGPARHPLVEPSLFYDPPYATPLDEAFAWHLVKYLAPASGLQAQVEGPVAGAGAGALPARLDFLVERGPHRRVGLVWRTSDDPARDRLHDALVMGSGLVDVLYRLRPEDVAHRLHDALLVAARFDPSLFSERGRINLGTLAMPEARACRPASGTSVVHVHYDDDATAPGATVDLLGSGEAPPPDLEVRRLDVVHDAAWRPAFDRVRATYGPSSPRRAA
jgi:hypothetical protein